MKINEFILKTYKDCYRKINNYFINGSIFYKLITIIIVILFITFINNMPPTKALASEESNSKYSVITSYESIRIEEGDSLWNIANEKTNKSLFISTSEYIEKVKRINGLNDNTINCGEYIIVPIYKSAE